MIDVINFFYLSNYLFEKVFGNSSKFLVKIFSIKHNSPGMQSLRCSKPLNEYFCYVAVVQKVLLLTDKLFSPDK